ncbi:2-oxoacid:ferredoxin oxidoreductase subunit beta [candidate division WOR-3 bacterium JGI_Cruoil_03_51_56]|uniref:2-oxoacid:ferredoxin oxidoreductase subunit beta n=1 Tax=candidate division WOR-3 bacterium JGI_Cruoil_03_51_56 TaxID=1973747 RepID=A0A235BNZ5_UNCW3|nr:MAG: 2-oxoacid:ferredoxin oxidoreductase subunit beta [candidate division WOR-3 bacterium JGI_Cruoil_03_51_56]
MDKFLDFFRLDERFPHMLCPGCGVGIAMATMVRAFIELGINQDKLCVVSGIGCSGRVAGYLDCDTFHTLHGRAIPSATGVKLARPDMHVVVFGGDGDIMAIGGNHFIHAARRNMDITVFVLNNRTYAMTGGQYSPTTPTHEQAATAPYGNCERSFDICFMARASGAMFVARSTTYHVVHLKKMMELALGKTGFSVVEIVSQCPTLYGRYQGLGDAVSMLKWIKERSIDVSKVEDPWHVPGKFVIGVLHDREEVAPYTELYQGVRNEARKQERC